MSAGYVPFPGTGVETGGNNVTSTIGVDDMLQKNNFPLRLDASRSSFSPRRSGNSRHMEARNPQPELSGERDRRFSLSRVLCIVPGRGMKAKEEDVTTLEVIDTIGAEAIECQPVSLQAKSKSWVFSRKEKQNSSIGSWVCAKDLPPAAHIHTSLKKPVVEVQNDNYQFAPMASVKGPVIVPESSTEMTRELREPRIYKYMVKNVVSLQPQRIGGNSSLGGSKKGKNNKNKTQKVKVLVVEEDDSRIPSPVDKSISTTRWISLNPKNEAENWVKDMIEGVEVVEWTRNEDKHAEVVLPTAAPGGKKLLTGSVPAERVSREGRSSNTKERVVIIDYQTEVECHNATERTDSPRADDNENEWVAPFSPQVFTFGGYDVASRLGSICSF